MILGVMLFYFTILAFAWAVYLFFSGTGKYPVFGVCGGRGMLNGLHRPGFWDRGLFIIAKAYNGAVLRSKFTRLKDSHNLDLVP